MLSQSAWQHSFSVWEDFLKLYATPRDLVVAIPAGTWLLLSRATPHRRWSNVDLFRQSRLQALLCSCKSIWFLWRRGCKRSQCTYRFCRRQACSKCESGQCAVWCGSRPVRWVGGECGWSGSPSRVLQFLVRPWVDRLVLIFLSFERGVKKVWVASLGESWRRWISPGLSRSTTKSRLSPFSVLGLIFVSLDSQLSWFF